MINPFLNKNFSIIGSAIAELFYPSHCEGCKKFLLKEKHLCSECWQEIERLSQYRCPVCSHQISKALKYQDAKNCPNCAGRQFAFDTAISAFQYKGLLQKLIFQFKYGGQQHLKKLLSTMLSEGLEDERLKGIPFTAVVPVPLYSLRQREREFNQARLLADELAQQLKLPVHDILLRIKATSHQARATRKVREENLKNAFKIKKRNRCQGSYLLIDDVLTTGSTAHECANVLREAGADKVIIITVAR